MTKIASKFGEVAKNMKVSEKKDGKSEDGDR